MESGVIEKSLSGLLVEVVSVKSLCSRDACITEVEALIQGQLVVAQGTSRRNPEDKHVPEIAKLLASGRALQSVARKLQRRADGLMVHQEKIAQQRPLQLEKSAAWHKERRRLIALSNDPNDKVRREALRQLRINEGSWDPHDAITVGASRPIVTAVSRPKKAAAAHKKSKQASGKKPSSKAKKAKKA